MLLTRTSPIEEKVEHHEEKKRAYKKVRELAYDYRLAVLEAKRLSSGKRYETIDSLLEHRIGYLPTLKHLVPSEERTIERLKESSAYREREHSNRMLGYGVRTLVLLGSGYLVYSLYKNKNKRSDLETLKTALYTPREWVVHKDS